MPEFGSSEWVDALIGALNASPDELRGVEVTIQQVVTGAPAGEVRYWTAFKEGTVEGAVGDAPSRADVTITQDFETARALSAGELNPQGAFMQGKLKVTGNMGKLLQHQDAIQALGPAMATIQTEFESG